MPNIDIEYLRQWIGKVESAADCITSVPVRALAATLDLPDINGRPGDRLPPMWHILFFLPLNKRSELNRNGHPRLGAFMPPISLPRRMYAGGRMQFHSDLKIGDEISRQSRITDVSFKQGRTGPLVFLQLRHEINNADGLAITETQDIVYRADPGPDSAEPSYQAAPVNEQWLRELTTDPIMLFRFSALTFNGHRIHYDHPYTVGEEGYPGLIVHGPLLAILLLDLLHRYMPGSRVEEFRFRALKPVFDSIPFFLCGVPADNDRVVNLWIRDAQGMLCLEASAVVA